MSMFPRGMASAILLGMVGSLSAAAGALAFPTIVPSRTTQPAGSGYCKRNRGSNAAAKRAATKRRNKKRMAKKNRLYHPFSGQAMRLG